MVEVKDGIGELIKERMFYAARRQLEDVRAQNSRVWGLNRRLAQIEKQIHLADQSIAQASDELKHGRPRVALQHLHHAAVLVADHPDLAPAIKDLEDRLKQARVLREEAATATAKGLYTKAKESIEKSLLLDPESATAQSLQRTATTEIKDARALRRNHWIAGLVIGAAFGTLAVVLAYWFGFRDNWQERNLARVSDLRRQIEVDYQSRHFFGVVVQADPLLAEAQKHLITEQMVKQDLDQIRAVRERAANAISPSLAGEKEAARLVQNHQLVAATQKFDALLADAAKLAGDDSSASDFIVRLRTQRSGAQAALDDEIRETQRKEQERQQKVIAERQRLVEAERRHQEELRRAAQEQARLAILRFSRSTEYTALKKSASELVSSYDRQQALEDSAYRSKSQAAKVVRQLLAIEVRIQARLAGKNFDREVARVESTCDISLIGEDSAIRAVYKQDQGTFDLLGLWCKLLDEREPGTYAGYLAIQSRVIPTVATEDSAPRAENALTESSLESMQLVLAAQGLKKEADAVLTSIQTRNLVEDSAYRASTKNTEGILELCLLMLQQKDKPTATQIAKDVDLAITGDTSTLRVNARQREGIMRGLNALIRSY